MCNFPQEHRFTCRNVRLSSYRREPDRFELPPWQLEEWLLVWPQQVSDRFPLDFTFIPSFYIPSELFILQPRGFCKDPESQHFGFPFSYSRTVFIIWQSQRGNSHTGIWTYDNTGITDNTERRAEKNCFWMNASFAFEFTITLSRCIGL